MRRWTFGHGMFLRPKTADGVSLPATSVPAWDPWARFAPAFVIGAVIALLAAGNGGYFAPSWGWSAAGLLWASVVALVFGIILAQTRFGRYTYAIGSNEEGVRRTGVNVDRHLIKVYALCGALAGLAGALSLARFGTTSIAGNTTLNLDAIAAIVIGGTSLFGGVGTVLGTVVGVFIPAVLQNGFVITGVETFWRDVAIGAVLIAAVYLDQLRRRTQYRD